MGGLLTVCAPALSCDLEALRHYPMTKALENRAVPLRMPDLFFKSAERRDFDRFSLDAAGAAEMRASLPEAHRWIIVVRIFVAEMLNGSAHQAFFNSSGVLAPDVAAALKAMHEAMIATARAANILPK